MHLSNLIRCSAVAALAIGFATSSCGTSTESQNGDPNLQFTAIPPTIPAGDNFQTIITLDASGSNDPDGDPITFLWDVPLGQFENGTTNTDTIPQVSLPGIAPTSITLRVQDSFGNRTIGSFTIDLTIPPVK